MNPIPHIFLVTFPDQPWNRLAAISILDAAQIPSNRLTIVTGIPSTSMTLRCSTPRECDDSGHELFTKPDAIAKSLSHRVALGVALASPHDSFIILEDTCRLDQFIERWSTACEKMPPDIEVAQLQYLDKDLEVQLSTTHPHWARCRPYPFCSGALYWTRSAATKLIQTMWDWSQPYDIMLIHKAYPYLNHYIARPAMAHT